ncbi:hypothetical protein CEXT_701991 [Caerostris extrusa]|uniref:Uncharacterized protein n=1 Tax=Caerostris extrusa TaxID=172846 RepID=A0AAV4PKT1_CAEEX|nr:hypothetical protein CEXT_701991 [Caerostris extrusa]
MSPESIFSGQCLSRDPSSRDCCGRAYFNDIDIYEYYYWREKKKESEWKEGGLTILINEPDHVNQFRFGWPLPQRPHHDPEFSGLYGPIAVMIEQPESFLEFCKNIH